MDPVEHLLNISISEELVQLPERLDVEDLVGLQEAISDTFGAHVGSLFTDYFDAPLEGLHEVRAASSGEPVTNLLSEVQEEAIAFAQRCFIAGANWGLEQDSTIDLRLTPAAAQRFIEFLSQD